MMTYLPVSRQGVCLLLLLSCTSYLMGQAGITQQQAVGSMPGLVNRTYNEDAKSWYAAYNTGDTVHVYLAVTDPVQQRKIISNGMELWIDTRGKKNKRTGILFPFIVHAANERIPQGPPPGNGPVRDNSNIPKMEKDLSAAREMKLVGFTGELNGLQTIHHPSGITVSLYFIQDTLVYDAQLPLNILPEPPLVNSRISIGLVEKGMDFTGFGGNDMPPPNGGGEGMMPPPGNPGDGPPPGGEDGMRLFQDNIIWFKFLLQNNHLL